MEISVKNIHQAILDGNNTEITGLVRQALEAGLAPKQILDEGMVAAMAEVGRLFEQGEYYVPEMLISARAMQTGLAVLKPSLKEANVSSSGKVVIGTVKGDLHDIGKNLVGMMLEGAGFEILDLGTDVTPERFASAADHADVIALSALLTTTMPSMKGTLDALAVTGKRSQVKVIIGGAPVTEAFSQSIGADGYAPDASRAVALVKSLLGK